MAKSIRLTNNKWRQPLKDRTSFEYFRANDDVAAICGLEDKQRRKISIETSHGVVLPADNFAISSGREVYIPVSLQHFLEEARSKSVEAYFDATILDAEEVLLGDDVDSEAVEGRIALVTHVRRERQTKLVQKKKRQAKALACEICNFIYSEKYREPYSSYIECHHLVPLAKGERETTLEDLILVCSSCHRIIHRLLRDHPDVADVTALKSSILIQVPSFA